MPTDDAAPAGDPKLARYSRQMLYQPIGEAGQKRLVHSQVVIIGVGALGGVLANTLVRAGVGNIRIIDRDFIELDNLQRQVLFDERDIAENLPKAEAAARKLRRINSAVEVEGIVADVNHENIESLCNDADLLLDGSDNFETRFLINDVAVKLELPWIYGAVIAAEGLVMPIIPHETPCLRCIWEDAPPPGMSPTCDTAGVLGPVVNMVASRQALEAIKLLAGRADAVVRKLVTIDAWRGVTRGLDMQSALEKGDCPCCKHGRYEYLSGERAASSTTLCGRDAVQLLPAKGVTVDFKQIAQRFPAAHVKHGPFMLRIRINEHTITLFPDGRAIIKGTSDSSVARGIYAKYIGS